MRRLLRGFLVKRLRLVLALLVGVVAFVPLVGARMLIASHIHERASVTVEDLTRQILGRAEAIIEDGLDTLNDLASSGVANCSETSLDAMRRAVYLNYSIKASGISDETGRLICNHIGDEVRVKPLSIAFPASGSNVRLQVVQLGDATRYALMMTWPLATGGGLSVVIPSEAVATDLLPTDLRASGLGIMTLTDGTLVGTVPPLGKAPAQGRFDASAVVSKLRSNRFPIEVSLFVPHSVFVADSANLITWANVGGLIIATAIITLAIYAVRRPRGGVDELREALAAGEFIPYYQPIVNLQTGRLSGCEVLIRRRMPDGTIIPPGSFIALAEQSGLALPMTRALMAKVRDDLDSVYGRRPYLKMGINLFDAHFADLRIIDDIVSIFGGSAIGYHQLTLEITERRPLENIELARKVIQALQDLGARVALDDAGTGHGGLAYLQQLGIDVLKIDKMFIDTIGKDRLSAPILDSLIRIGVDLEMEVVAEGVESFEQVEYLRARGVHGAQGYLFAPPLPFRSFVDLVSAMDPLKGEDERMAPLNAAAA